MKILIILFYSVIFAASAHGFGVKDTYLGIGSYTAMPGKVQTDDSGDTNGLFDLEPYILAGMEYQIYEDWSAFAEAGFVKPGSGRDPLVSKMTYFFLFSGAYNFMDWVFKLGTGLSMTRISTDGGTQTLNNGTTRTDFPMPDAAVVSQNLITTIGIEYYFHQEMSVKLEGHYFNLASEDGQAWSHTLSLSYHFGNIFDSSKQKRARQ